MSRTHRIGSGDLGFPLRELKERKTLGARALWLMCAASILLGTTSIPESNPSPVTGTPMEAMRTTVSQALRILQDPDLKKPERTDERVTQLKKIANVRFDYGEMAKRSLGSQWNKLEEKERQEFVGLFTEFLTATYVEKIHAYSGEEVKFLNERLEGDHAASPAREDCAVQREDQECRHEHGIPLNSSRFGQARSSATFGRPAVMSRTRPSPPRPSSHCPVPLESRADEASCGSTFLLYNNCFSAAC